MVVRAKNRSGYVFLQRTAMGLQYLSNIETNETEHPYYVVSLYSRIVLDLTPFAADRALRLRRNTSLIPQYRVKTWSEVCCSPHPGPMLSQKRLFIDQPLMLINFLWNLLLLGLAIRNGENDRNPPVH
ncbi:unnamed protein product [Gongylonema pulchrum]|uniref:Uncharacterized protein n=1 Tax=Gongylonema pulchrum TaxID=637853 RepID=A0A183D4U7_9BILA|nr:unnamed protein product [Gongylonema pulchrum]